MRSKGTGLRVCVDGKGMKERDLGIGKGTGRGRLAVTAPCDAPQPPDRRGLRYLIGADVMSGRLEAPALVEAVAVRLDAQLRPPRDVREGPLHRPLMLLLD